LPLPAAEVADGDANRAAAEVSLAFGGVSTGKQVEGDPFLGDWEGQWIDPRGILRWNPGIVAQIIPRGGGRYQINILPEFDHRCVPYAVIHAKAEGPAIRFDQAPWSGTVTPDGFAGEGKLKEEAGRFELAKVKRPSPLVGAKPPVGAVVLFDGTSFDEWEPSGRKPNGTIAWELDGDVMRIRSSPDGTRHSLRTKRRFGDVKLHIEFRLPLEPENTGQGRANSGVSVGGYEIQVLDSYGLPGYYNECGAIYKIAAPMVNMCAPPLEWQTFDVTFRRARFNEAGEKIADARITVHHNGVAIHHDREIRHRVYYKPRVGRTEPVDAERAPISLQNHRHPIEFRNIWAVELE
jgi:hypothetical protein